MLHLPFGRSQLECDVLSFDVAQLAKPFAKRGERQLTPRSRQEPDSPEFARFLRLDCDRYREHAPTHQGDERSPVHHWMISSARTRTDCGIVSPSVLAVLRLITNSNVVGCST